MGTFKNLVTSAWNWITSVVATVVTICLTKWGEIRGRLPARPKLSWLRMVRFEHIMGVLAIAITVTAISIAFAPRFLSPTLPHWEINNKVDQYFVQYGPFPERPTKEQLDALDPSGPLLKNLRSRIAELEAELEEWKKGEDKCFKEKNAELVRELNEMTEKFEAREWYAGALENPECTSRPEGNPFLTDSNGRKHYWTYCFASEEQDLGALPQLFYYEDGKAKYSGQAYKPNGWND